MYPSLPSLGVDTWTLSRKQGPTPGDYDDIPAQRVAGTTPVAWGRGALGWTQPRDGRVAGAAHPDQVATLSTNDPSEVFRPGDTLEVRGHRFRVIGARRLRTRTRVSLADAMASKGA